MHLRFIKYYGEKIRSAFAARERPTGHGSSRIVITAVLLVVVYLIVSVVLVPTGKVPEFNFVDERGTVTVLSALLLAIASGFAFVAFLISAGDAWRHRLFWLVVAGAVGFLAFDELLQFHERVGRRLDRVDTLRSMVDQTPIRNWNDVVVIMYGIPAFAVGLYFWPSAIRFSRVFEFLCVAAVFYVLHTAIDSVVEPRTTLSVILEESSKVFTALFLAIASLDGLLCLVKRFSASKQREFPELSVVEHETAA